MTYIELILILSLLGALFSICYPAFSSLGERVESDQFLHLVASELRLAQVEAKSYERTVAVTIDQEQRRVATDREGEWLHQVTIPPRYRLTSNYPRHRIAFSPTGQVRGGTLTLYRGGRVMGEMVIHVASGQPEVKWMP